ncbi:MAG: hypothetical protein WD967_00535, partial [Candidatus Levyibacteriota bacterium]
MLQVPFYDPTKTYEDNYEFGPFGDFKRGAKYKEKEEPQYDFLGFKVNLPFGIPAGPLLNSNFVKGAFENGFDIAVYKTVRSGAYPCHPFPNVLSVKVDGDLTIEKTKKPLFADINYGEPLSITNSFGVPSRDSSVWQEDVKRAISYEGRGQVMILSFMGTVREDQTQEEFIEDYVLAAKLAKETGAKVLEANLSCPNIGNEGLVCYNLEVTEKVVRGIRSVIGNTPLVLKIGYFENDDGLLRLAEIANEYASSIAGINTLPAQIIDNEGNQALPGPNRKKAGVCGSAIKWAGVKTVKRLNNIKQSNGFKFSIEGVGGVMETYDYFDYMKAGASSVMSATGAMWNPKLAIKIKE